MYANLVQRFEVQVREIEEMTDKAISLNERLDKLKNLMTAQGILSSDSEKLFKYLDISIRVYRYAYRLWIYLPTKEGIFILNKLDKATTMEEVDSILSQTTFGK
jgi:hypothetical protein